MPGLRVTLTALLMLIAPAVSAAECVVMLHGLGRGPSSMWALQFALQRAGYQVWNQGYPSTERRIRELSGVVGEAIENCRTRRASRIHFVTHSMGGILLREYFQDHLVVEAGRVVMLAPPNGGSEIVDAYKDRWWFRWATGPAGQELGTGVDALPGKLKPIPLEIGIIAGTSSSDPWFSGLYTGANDGKVSVRSAALLEMKDLLQVHSGHTWMMNSPRVIAQVKAFLRAGTFDRNAAAE